MRELTQQQKDSAPDWATHYFRSQIRPSSKLKCEDEPRVRWQNNEKRMFLWSHETCEPRTTEHDFHELGEPIPN